MPDFLKKLLLIHDIDSYTSSKGERHASTSCTSMRRTYKSVRNGQSHSHSHSEQNNAKCSSNATTKRPINHVVAFVDKKRTTTMTPSHDPASADTSTAATTTTRIQQPQKALHKVAEVATIASDAVVVNRRAGKTVRASSGNTGSESREDSADSQQRRYDSRDRDLMQIINENMRASKQNKQLQSHQLRYVAAVAAAAAAAGDSSGEAAAAAAAADESTSTAKEHLEKIVVILRRSLRNLHKKRTSVRMSEIIIEEWRRVASRIDLILFFISAAVVTLTPLFLFGKYYISYLDSEINLCGVPNSDPY